MNKYKIVVYNYFNSVIYEDYINADNENKALLKFLDDNIVCSGDKIEII